MNTGGWDRLDQGQFFVPYGDAASCLQSDHSRHRQSLIFICIIQHHHTHLLRCIVARDLDDVLKWFLGHCGACRPDDESQSLMWGAVSSCLIFLRSASISGPGFNWAI